MAGTRPSQKFNPHHGRGGLFASAGGGGISALGGASMETEPGANELSITGDETAAGSATFNLDNPDDVSDDDVQSYFNDNIDDIMASTGSRQAADLIGNVDSVKVTGVNRGRDYLSVDYKVTLATPISELGPNDASEVLSSSNLGLSGKEKKMPWHLQPAGDGKAFVVDDTGKKYSDKPLPKWQAKRQMKALYAKEPQKKQFIEHTGATVALPIPEAFQLTRWLQFPPEVELEPPNEMHVTLAFLGDVTEGNIDPEKLFSVVSDFALSYPPIVGKINGYGIFNETHMDDKECLWLSLDAAALPEMRQALIKMLDQKGFPVMMDHGFTPHITVAYFPKGSDLPELDFEPQDVMIPFLRAAWADLVKDFPFGGVMSKETMMKDGLPASAYLVVEDPQKVTTWHLAVHDAQGKPDHRLMGAAWAALHGGYRGNKYEGPGKTEAIARLRKMYEAEKMPMPGEKSFRAFKQADGSYRWVLISSSAFRDRDGEIVTAKALAEDVDRCDAAKEYGPLRWWHLGGWEYPDGPENWQTWKAAPGGLDLGTCDFNMLHGKMLIESGTFKDAVIGEAVSEIQDELEASIMFSHPADEPGKSKEFQNIHRIERSLLPAGMASNLLTKLYVSKGEPAMNVKEKLAAWVAIFQDKPDVAKQILADAEVIEKTADLVGLDSKEVGEMFAVKDEETPPVTEPPAEPPALETVDEIGDMTRAQLTSFIAEAVKPLFPQPDPAAAAKQAGQEQLLADALLSLKSLGDRFAAMEATLKETKQTLDELTDARPVGIKQLQNSRPTQSEKNIVQAAPTGPQMDPAFLKFLNGGK